MEDKQTGTRRKGRGGDDQVLRPFRLSLSCLPSLDEKATLSKGGRTTAGLQGELSYDELRNEQRRLLGRPVGNEFRGGAMSIL